MLEKRIGVLIFCLLTQLIVNGEEGETTVRAEQAVVEATLNEHPNFIVLAVNGLCCRSCAIGIGKKVCELDFVNTDALPKGVKVDRKHSLLTVAVKDKEAIDISSLTHAIRKAGYEPVRLYQRIENGSINVTEIPK